LQSAHPDVVVEVWDSPTGSLTAWQGHDVGIDCMFKDRHHDESDNVALSVSLSHLDKAPTIDSADVVWGHPSGHVEASVLQAPVGVSEESFGAVIARLPELCAALERALNRGQPPAK
jgi:hypothetical protein